MGCCAYPARRLQRRAGFVVRPPRGRRRRRRVSRDGFGAWPTTSRILPARPSLTVQAAVMALAPAMMVSRRCSKKARGIFIREINAGGLLLLNQVGR